MPKTRPTLSRFAILIRALPVVYLTACGGSKPEPVPPPQHTVLADPAVPPAALFSAKDLPIHSGVAFAARTGDRIPVLLTAKHLLIPSLGAPPTDLLEIPDAVELGQRGAAGDIAAIPTASAGQPTPFLELATEIPDSGLWVVTPGTASGSLQFDMVKLMAQRGGLVYYSISGTNEAKRLSKSAGSPVVDTAGRAVALHLGTGQDDDGSHFGIANPVSRFLPHLLAALPNPTPAKSRLASAPEPQPGEIVPEN